MTESSTPRPPLLVSLVPVLALVGLLVLNVRVFGSADNQIALALATAVAASIAVWGLKVPWQTLEQAMFRSIGQAMQAIVILAIVGMLIGAWIESGVVPALILWGLELISPGVFLLTACLVCCVVSIASGSSWTTAGTVGVALMGVGTTMGIAPGMVAGAIVSGAYFGDKMSPLSDTTNLAPAMAGSTLMEHVRHMVWTTTPALLLALGAYAVFGLDAHEQGADALARIVGVKETLRASFVISPWLLVPPALVLGLVILKKPAVPALFAGTFAAVAIGLLLQPRGEAGLAGDLQRYFSALWGGYERSFGAGEAAQAVEGLLSGKGGMKAMMATIAIVFCSLSFGGVMEKSGMLGSIAGAILSLVRGTGSLVTATVATCIGANVLTSDQYMAIVVPGRMFRPAFLRARLHPKNLSRCLEDAGTVTSALVPWNTCGVQMATVLGVSTLAYAPWAILNWACPLISIAYGFSGFSMVRISDEEARRREADG
ncbi:MAG: Na+/H+ antiporter NhaC [Planctomycetes bacterium]|nr:Na+/H+ antiporter NhaC [Planctomycetota bacterium]